MRPSHNIGAEYTMVYSIRDVTRGQTPVMGAVIYFNIFIDMKKIIFFVLIITTFSSCYMERRMYTHYHPWERMNHVHRYHVPRIYKPYVAPSKVYKKRGF